MIKGIQSNVPDTCQIPVKKLLELENQGYRIIGNHSAIKICGWTKNSIRNEGTCYKNKFYGIHSHRCVQMTPALQHCNFRCWHCWRDIATASKEWSGPIDDPKDIVDGCVREHVRMLQGFGGNDKSDKEKVEEMNTPLHFAISLTGEPTMYPRIGDLIDEIKSRGYSAYLVTNGSQPEQVRKLIGHEPTQFYVTLAAPNRDMFIKDTNPLTKDAWERFNETLQLMKDMKCRRVLRLTLTKGFNMQDPEEYGRFIKDLHFDFVEVKGYMWVGYSRQRLKKDNMPTHEEIRDFSKRVAESAGLRYIDEQERSSVVLLMRNDFEGRVMWFDEPKKSNLVQIS